MAVNAKRYNSFFLNDPQQVVLFVQGLGDGCMCSVLVWFVVFLFFFLAWHSIECSYPERRDSQGTFEKSPVWVYLHLILLSFCHLGQQTGAVPLESCSLICRWYRACRSDGAGRKALLTSACLNSGHQQDAKGCVTPSKGVKLRSSGSHL